MSALNQLIVIVNLLYKRRCVSIKTIREICGISDRTAYRYIDKISRAGIPLYYDKNLGGYTLITKKIKNAGNTALEETAGLLGSSIDKDISGDQLAVLITSALLQTTIRLNSKVKIVCEKNGKLAEIHIEHPRLKFNNDWTISEIEENSQESVAMSEIMGVHIK
jgi:hypothetical protein